MGSAEARKPVSSNLAKAPAGLRAFLHPDLAGLQRAEAESSIKVNPQALWDEFGEAVGHGKKSVRRLARVSRKAIKGSQLWALSQVHWCLYIQDLERRTDKTFPVLNELFEAGVQGGKPIWQPVIYMAMLCAEADCCRLRKEFDAAETKINKQISTVETFAHGEGKSFLLSTGYYYATKIATDQEKWDEAIDFASRAIRIKDLGPEFKSFHYYNLAFANWLVDRYEESVKYASLGLGFEGTSALFQADLYAIQSICYAELAEYQTAAEAKVKVDLKRCSFTDFLPSDHYLQLNIADSYFCHGEFERAIKESDKALRLTSNDEETVDTLRFRAVTYMRLGLVGEAERDFKSAKQLAIKTNDVDGLVEIEFAKIRSLMYQSKFSEAFEATFPAEEMCGDNWHARGSTILYRGECRSQMADAGYEAAISDYSQILEDSSFSRVHVARANAEIGHCYFCLEDNEAASRYWLKALAIDELPEHTRAAINKHLIEIGHSGSLHSNPAAKFDNDGEDVAELPVKTDTGVIGVIGDRENDSTSALVEEAQKPFRPLPPEADVLDDLNAFMKERIPGLTEADKEQLIGFIEDLRDNPPDGIDRRRAAAAAINKALDVWDSLISIGDGKLYRLRVLPGSNNQGYVHLVAGGKKQTASLRGKTFSLARVPEHFLGSKLSPNVALDIN